MALQNRTNLADNELGYQMLQIAKDLLQPKIINKADSIYDERDPVEWIEKFFYIPETNGPITLGEYQKSMIRHALAKDSEGMYQYSTIVWSDIKKSAKSTLAAAVGLWVAFTIPWASVKVIANDLKQADSRVFFYMRRAIELSPFLQTEAKVKLYNISIMGNHSHVEAIPIDPKGEAGGNDDAVIYSELWGAKGEMANRMWCFDDKTEILTKQGWINGVDLTTDFDVATFDNQTELIHWEKPRYVFKDHYQGEMHLYENRRFSKCVTPEHRLLGIFAYGGRSNPYARHGVMRSNELRSSGFGEFYVRTAPVGYIPSQEEPKEVFIPETKFKPEYKISWSDWCEFMGWFVSEGNVKRNHNNPVTVVITQDPKANPREWQKIKDCLTRCFGANGFSINYRDTSFRIHSAPLAKLLAHMTSSYNKYVPVDIKESSPDNLQTFLDALIDGDGTRKENGSFVLYTHSKKLADDVCEIATKLSYTWSLRTQTQKLNGTTQYRVCIFNHKEYFGHLVERKDWKTIQYDGQVWCPSVSTGFIVVRRNGKVCISGNTESTLSPTKFGKSFRWCETYSGFSGESEILEKLWISAVKMGEQLPWAFELEPPLEVFENKEARILALWNSVPRLPWQTPAYYAQEEASLSPSEFSRVHRNQWVSPESVFVPAEWWVACEDANIPALGKDDPTIIAVDAGVTNDNFAMVLVSGRYVDNGDIDVRYTGLWRPPKGGRIDFSKPEAELRRLIEVYNVVEIVYDMYQLEDMAGRMKRELIAKLYSFNQGNQRSVADKNLFDMIRDRRVHYFSEPVLTEHVLNANAKTEGNSKMRIVKRSDAMKIDLAVCLSMAAARAKYWRI